MKVTVLYRPQSEFARSVEEFAHDMTRQQSIDVNMVDVDSREGMTMAELYGILEYPAILVTRDDNELIQYWVGTSLPLMGEVAAYARS